MVIFSSSKVDSLYHQRKKPAKLVWTQAWRRMHKKLNVEAAQKKKARRVVKVATRGYTGLEFSKIKETRRPAGAAKKPTDPNAPKVVVQQVRHSSCSSASSTASHFAGICLMFFLSFRQPSRRPRKRPR